MGFEFLIGLPRVIEEVYSNLKIVQPRCPLCLRGEQDFFITAEAKRAQRKQREVIRIRLQNSSILIFLF